MIRSLLRVYLAKLLIRRAGSCLLPVVLVVVALLLLVFWAL